jgi:hypothetical protein
MHSIFVSARLSYVHKYYAFVLLQVKVLGALAMIDDGELDWKVLAIDVRDPLAELLKDIEDVDTHCPGVVSGTTFCAAFSFNISLRCFLSKLTNMGVKLLSIILLSNEREQTPQVFASGFAGTKLLTESH